MQLHSPYRPATIEDADVLAELVNIAGEGFPLYLWTGMAEPGQSPWEVGRERAKREVGGFSYRNAIVREENGNVVACLIGYPLDDEPACIDYQDMPAMFVPLQQLEDMVPRTWYVNVLACLPEHRGQGYGSELLTLAEAFAKDTGKNGLSIIVANTNNKARRLYEKSGYREHAQRPMTKENWSHPATNWILLVKDI